jgi:hypothetical protein
MGPRGREAALGAGSHIPMLIDRTRPLLWQPARQGFMLPLNEERLAAELHRIH